MDPPQVWNVPYPRNALFTGRTDLLDQLATALRTGQSVTLSQLPTEAPVPTDMHPSLPSTGVLSSRDIQPQAISGLGGIGKTQVALEYAYRHWEAYEAVLWVQAETKETVTSSYLEVARLLNLPEKDAQESSQVIEAVKEWLRISKHYLLILDNADDLRLASEFVPPTFGGHIVLTTRAQAMGRFARQLEVETLPIEQGVEFLLRRANVLGRNAPLEQASEENQKVARDICTELGCLPLALDQAGAYIEERRCGLLKYLQRCRQQRGKVLAQRRGVVNDHPLPVATTWHLSFEQVEQKSPAGADVLRVCAFVAPDAIPERLLVEGAMHLGPALAGIAEDEEMLEEGLEALQAYSLVKRDAEKQQLSVHRLVQAVLRDQMGQESQRQWAERTVRAMDATFPEVEHQNWPMCEQLVPHALVGAALIEQYQIRVPEAASLLHAIGMYLIERARYGEAEKILLQAQSLREETLGQEHTETAATLDRLARAYERQGKYGEAEPLYERSLQIREQQLGEKHPSVAQSLNNLGLLYQEQGKYGEAEPLLERALAISEQALGMLHPSTGSSLNNLAMLYKAQGKYAEAEPLYERALAIDEAAYGKEHPETARVLNNLAKLYIEQRKYLKAELLMQRALAIAEAQWGTEHPETATCLNNLAELYRLQGKYAEAEPLMQRALVIREEQLGAEHPETATSLNNLANLYWSQGKYGEAESLLERALAINEKQLGALHPDTAISLGTLAQLYIQQGNYSQAELRLRQALIILEQHLGKHHPHTATCLNELANVYQAQGKYGEAEPLYKQALAIREQELGAIHPDTATSLNNLAALYQQQGKYAEAEPLYTRALAIKEQVLGSEHSSTRLGRSNYASLLRMLGREREAEDLEARNQQQG